jgi:GNAT superfamily N-acetyltransferase
MHIKYINSCENVSWEEVANTIEIVGWGSRSLESIRSSFEKSTFAWFAYDGEKLVGFGRSVDDGHYYAWIVDLAVLPEYQGQGIGSEILKKLETDLKPFITTMLTAVPGKGSFYEKLGWLKQTSAYIFPRSQGQVNAFAK